jgi:hypothetical protein
MRQDAKLRQQGIDTEVYRARRQVARIILAHECNLTQPNRRAAGRNPQNETRPIRGAEVAESTRASEPVDFTVSLHRQTSCRPNQTYVVGGMEDRVGMTSSWTMGCPEGIRRTRRSTWLGSEKVAPGPEG